MAIVKVIEIKGEFKQAEKSFEELGNTIQEQKDITIEFEKELDRLEKQLKSTSKANLPAQKAIKGQIVGIKDALKDQRLSLKDLNNQRSKITGAKSAEKAEKKLKASYFETNEAMTDVNRLTSEYALKLKGLKNLISGSYKAALNFIKGLSGIKKALLATGIGAIVVALGLIVAYWDEITDFINGTNKALEKKIKLNEENLKVLDSQLKTNELLNKLAESEGKSVKQIKEDRRKLLELQLLATAASITDLALQLEQQRIRANELSTLQKIGKFLSGNRAFKKTETEEEKKNIKDTELALNKLGDKAIQIRTILNNLDKPDKKKKDKTEEDKFKEFSKEADKIQKKIDLEEKERERIRAQREKDNEELQTYLEKQEEIETDAEDLRVERELKASITRTKNAQAEADAKIAMQLMLASQIGNALGNISQLFEQGTAASKAAALAEVVIGTGIGFIQALDIAQKTAKGTGPAAAFAFPIFYASQIAAVLGAAGQAKNILSTVPGGGGGGGISAPSVEQVSPNFNVVGASDTNQLAQSISNKTQEPVKAFVVSNDVTTQQALDRQIEDTATFG